jgi:hypothetical protein
MSCRRLTTSALALRALAWSTGTTFPCRPLPQTRQGALEALALTVDVGEAGLDQFAGVVDRF